MELRSVSGQVSVARLASMERGSNRISLPVSRALSPYAQFKYVKGIPSDSKGQSLPVNRLQVLDNLIKSLVRKQSDPLLQMDPSKLSDESVKALIDQYSSELHSTLQAPGAYGASGLSYNSGALVNVLV